MKFICLLLILLTEASLTCHQTSQAASSTDDTFFVTKGTNVAHWLSQSKRIGQEREQYFTEDDVKAIAEMGFDHIRLPVDEEQLWDESGQRHDDAFSLLEKCINWSIDSKLRVIVDLHILRSHHFNADVKPLWTEAAEQEKFFDLWRDLSKTLKQFPNHMVAYELMNEAVADDHESWNTLLDRAFTAIREIEPERTIVIGSNRWQSASTFDALRVPANDPNILLSFHFYEPFLLTHFAASWTDLKDYRGPLHYPGIILTQAEYDVLPEDQKPVVEKWIGREFNKASMLEMWEQPINKAKQLGLPLYCGEFGIVEEAPKKDRLIWYQDMIELFNETGIAYANWNYKSGNFGLIDGNGEQRREELISIVSGK